MSSQKEIIKMDEVVIRFSGDSGDGMQLTGTQFSDTSALFGNEVSTFPDYPAEIRAPQGTVGGVSGFQVHFGRKEILTPGDYCDVLVAMNPAALKANLQWVKPTGTIIINIDSFDEKNIKKAGYTSDPLEDNENWSYKLVKANITNMTKETLKDSGLDQKSIVRSKNMFALGIVYWMFDRPLDHTLEFLDKKFAKVPLIAESNKKVLKAGFNFAHNIQALAYHYEINPAHIKKGTYRNITGNKATAWGLMAAAEKANLPLFCGSYPITPATEILQELALRRDLGVKTIQAEDEIAGICTAIGASYVGNIGVTTTSGPGLALKSEAINLAVITELPLVIIDVQRGGPSTGLPTKTEQADLNQALFGRNGESPIPIVAASTSGNCFKFAYEATRLALEHMTPVILLTDGYLANGAQPWRIPSMKDLPSINPPIVSSEEKDFLPYTRDAKTLVRKWAIPGTKGLEHRIGGLEKLDGKGSISYIPENHELMCKYRRDKVQLISDNIPEQEVLGDSEGGELLVIGWGGTYGHLSTAVSELRKEGKNVSLAQFNYISPLPKNTKEIFSRFKKHIVFELNLGQFVNYLRNEQPEFSYHQYNKVQGLPFTIEEIKNRINDLLKEK